MKVNIKKCYDIQALKRRHLLFNPILLLYASLIPAFIPPNPLQLPLRGLSLYLWIIFSHLHNFQSFFDLTLFPRFLSLTGMMPIKSRLSLLVKLQIFISINCDLSSNFLLVYPTSRINYGFSNKKS